MPRKPWDRACRIWRFVLSEQEPLTTSSGFAGVSGSGLGGSASMPKAFHAEIKAAVRPELPMAKTGCWLAWLQRKAPTAA